MLVAPDRRVHEVGEHVAFHALRHLGIEVLHVGEPAAQHDHIGVEHIDDDGKAPCHAIDMPLQRRLRQRVPGGGAGGQFGCVHRTWTIAIAGEAGSGDIGLHAVMLAAPA